MDAAQVDGATFDDAATSCTPSAWSITPFPDDESRGGWFRIDASGMLHIVYATDKAMHYAHRAPGDVAWTTESLGARGAIAAIELDASGGVHVVYNSADNTHKFSYAYRAPAGDWTHELLGRDGVSGDVAVDGQGRVHVAYWTHPAYELKYARRVSANNWAFEDVDNAHVSDSVSLVVDSNLDAHLIYHTLDDGKLTYADHTASGWIVGNVDPVGSGYYASDLTIDETGTLHATYGAYSSWQPAYASRAPGGAWETDPTRAVNGWYWNAAIRSNGAYVVSHEMAHGFMWLGHHDVNGNWSSEIINPEGTPRGKFPSVALDSAGGIHVLFADLFQSRAYYAYRCP